MTPAVLSALAVFVPAGFFALVFVADLVGRKFSDGEFSWPKYAAFVGVALGLAVLLVAAKTTWVFLVVAGVLVLWVLIRGALDAQVTSIRERFGFLQLYAALLVVEYSALVRTSALTSFRATPAFSAVLDDVLSELVLPASLLVRGARAAGGAEPFVSSLVTSLSEHLLLVLSLATFALAAFVYAHFAQHATPKVGLSLFPSPTVAAVLWPVLAALSRLSGPSLAGTIAGAGATFLTPYFVAEGLWVVQRLASRLRIRGVLVGVLAAVSVVSPGFCHGLAVLGLGFHVVRLRAFEPILGDVERSASRPRIRTALLVSALASLGFAGLSAVDVGAFAKASPRLRIGASACDGVSFSATKAGVVVTTSVGSFTMDADETPVDDASAEALANACRARGERPCTSDEWTLACVCNYPNESEGGTKLGENDRLVFRLETERRDGTPVDVQRLLSGRAELVTPGLGRATTFAGPTEALDDPWMIDCRTRTVLTDPSRANGASAFAVRCCK